MKQILLLALSFISTSIILAQDFVPGYYIINSAARYVVALPSGDDFYLDEHGCMHQYEDLKMQAGEVVIAFEFVEGKYYCFDPNGRMVVFQGKNCLSKALMVDGSGLGQVDETIYFIQPIELTSMALDKGAYYWIVSQNIENATVKIQFANSEMIDVQQAKVTLPPAFIKNTITTQTYITIEKKTTKGYHLSNF